MSKIAIIGAGVMGRGVTQSMIEGGHTVFLHDVNEETLASAVKSVKNGLLSKIMTGAKIDLPSVMSSIKITTNLQDIAGAEYIIENITEDIEAKKILYQNLKQMHLDNVTIMINTSCIAITTLASYLSFPHRVIGTHFMNPVPLIKAVEVIQGYHTSDDTISAVMDLLASIGKNGILVKDFPGFVSNRISHLMMNEAAQIVQDGVATPEAVDNIFKECYGHKMGPLQTADLIGLDTVVNSLMVLYQSYQDPKYRCCPLLKKMVDAGLLGRKSGCGFYTY